VGYSESGDLVWYYGMFTWGSTTSASSPIELSLPVNAKGTGGAVVLRQTSTNFASVNDSSTGYSYPLQAAVSNASPATKLVFFNLFSNGTYLQSQAQPFQATAPTTMAVSDEIQWNVFYRKA
jgi:hypothetical protein